MFEKDVETKDGNVKHVVAHSQEELDEAVKAVKNDVQAVSPDLHSPDEPNAIVSPGNKHTEDIPSEVDNSVEPEQPEEPKKTKKKVKVVTNTGAPERDGKGHFKKKDSE